MSMRVKYIISLLALALMFLAVFLFYRTAAIEVYASLKEFILPKNDVQKEARMAFMLSKKDKVPNVPVQRLKVPENNAYLGADSGIYPTTVRQFEVQAERPVAVINLYTYWGSKAPYFNKSLASRLWLDNTILVISWNPSVSLSEAPVNQKKYRLYNINNGKFDAYIEKFARQLKAWRRPVVLRFGPEMNGDWVPWGTIYNTKNDYKEAYRHVYKIFQEVGTPNVSWMWSPNEADEDEVITDWYPGDKYVDWVGLSGFNWGVSGIDKQWRSFEEIYHRSFVQLKDINKPISLTELSCIEDKDPLRKGNWIRDTYSVIPAKFPKIKIVIWANIASHKVNWKITSSQESLDAFRESVSNPFYLDRAEGAKP